MPGQFFSIEAFCTELFGRMPGPPNLAIFNLAAIFAATTIAAGVAGRRIFVERLMMNVTNTGTFRLQDSTGVDVYGTALQEASVLGGVEHDYERLFWTVTLGAGLQIVSGSAGSLFDGRMIWRYV